MTRESISITSWSQSRDPNDLSVTRTPIRPPQEDRSFAGDPFWPNGLSQERRSAATLGGQKNPPNGGRTERREGTRVNTHLPVLWIAFAAAAALVVFLVVHTALEAFSQTSSLLAGT